MKNQSTPGLANNKHPAGLNASHSPSQLIAALDNPLSWQYLFNPVLNRLASLNSDTTKTSTDELENALTEKLAEAKEIYPLLQMPAPSAHWLPLVYRSTILDPCVSAGEYVTRGQALVHLSFDPIDNSPLPGLPSPVSGKIISSDSIQQLEIDTPPIRCIEIAPADCDKNEDNQTESANTGSPCFWQSRPWLTADRTERLELLLTSGISGHGGGGFLLTNKLRHPIDTLIINAVECEPLISCDATLIAHSANTVMQGILSLIEMTACKHCHIALENHNGKSDENPQALAIDGLWQQHALQQATDQLIQQAPNQHTGALQALAQCISFHTVENSYPSGAEKQLIPLITGASHPHPPVQSGICCINIATCHAVDHLTTTGEAPRSRIVTLCGDVVAEKTGQPSINIQVHLGTIVREALTFAGLPAQDVRIVQGGPVCGQEMASLDVPIQAHTNCLVVTKTTAQTANDNCIRCGNCQDVCPADLLPQDLYRFTHNQNLEAAAELRLDQCLLCGCCDLVCPSHIPLTTQFRGALQQQRKADRDQRKADLADANYKRRQQRLQLKEEKRAKRVAERRRVTDNSAAKKQAISDALARARKTNPKE